MKNTTRSSLVLALLASGAWTACAFEPDPLALQPENVFATANSAPAPSEAPVAANLAPPAIAPAPLPPPAQSAAPPAASEAPAPPAAAATAVPANAERRTLSGTVTSAARPQPGAVVYLEDGPIEPGVGASALVDQHNMAFVPFVSALAVGGTMTFLNEDPFPHNVYSPDGEKFNLGIVSRGVKRTRTFKQAGVYRLLCNLHPPMIAYVVVTPSSYFAITDRQGKFVMKNVPGGTYKVALWAPGKLAAETQSVKLLGADATIDFALHK